MKACDEDGGSLHVDRHGTDAPQVGFELFVMLPDAAVGCINGARPIVEIAVANGRRDSLLQIEGGQGRDFGREIIVRGAFAADGCNRKDQVAEFVLFLQPAALPKEEAGFGPDGRQQVHDRGGVGASHPKVDERDALGGDVGHGFLAPADGNIEPVRKHVQVIVEVDKQDVFAEIFEGRIGVARQPVGNNFIFGSHGLYLTTIPGIAAQRRAASRHGRCLSVNTFRV